MKELKELENIYLQKFDVEIHPYLSLSEIQKIINEVLLTDNFEERESIIDYLILCYATNIDRDTIDKLGPDIFLKSGLIDEVKNNINNLSKLYEGITYHESTGKAIREISKKLPEDLNEMMKNVVHE